MPRHLSLCSNTQQLIHYLAPNSTPRVLFCSEVAPNAPTCTVQFPTVLRCTYLHPSRPTTNLICPLPYAPIPSNHLNIRSAPPVPVSSSRRLLSPSVAFCCLLWPFVAFCGKSRQRRNLSPSVPDCINLSPSVPNCPILSACPILSRPTLFSSEAQRCTRFFLTFSCFEVP